MTTLDDNPNAVDHNKMCIAVSDECEVFSENGPGPPTLSGSKKLADTVEDEDDETDGKALEATTALEDDKLSVTPRIKSNVNSDPSEKNPVKFLGGECLNSPKSVMVPPIDYDPEGYVPQFVEVLHGTPPFVRWAQSLRKLLDDREGVELFKRYLQQERCEDSLDFWFACEGLKLQQPDAPDRLHQLIKLIYRKYLRTHNGVSVTSSTRKTIADRLAVVKSSGVPDQRIFDVAQREVEFNIRQSTYPNFLKSDIYLKYVQTTQTTCGGYLSLPRCHGGYASTSASGSLCGSLPSSRSSSSDGDCREDVSGLLPTVLEDCELKVDATGTLNDDTNLVPALPLTTRHLIATQRYRAGYSDVRRPEAFAGVYLRQSPTSNAPNPYHALYASFIPGSAQDSELQSLSSDAHTDDTISLTDSSLDGFPVTNKRRYMQQQNRAMRQNANQNKDPFSQHVFIPRTQRLQVERISPSDPERFFNVLSEKLEAVLRLQESQEKINESLRKLEYEENRNNYSCKADQESSSNRHQHPQQQQQQQQQLQQQNQQPLSSVILTAIRDGILVADDNDQSILDEHVSRIWDDSCHQTPSSRSPPPPSSGPPDKTRRSGHSVNPYQGGNNNNNNSNKLPSYLMVHHRHRKERDVASTFSGDSGAVPDYVDASIARTKVVGEIVDLPPGVLNQSRGHGLALVEGKRTSNKKFSAGSSSSAFDSGVSVAYEPSQASSIDSRDNVDKVMSWMQGSRKCCNSHASDSDKDSSVRHKKSTHSSNSANSSCPNRQDGGKRSGSLERSSHVPWAKARPRQPFMEHPSMPLFPQPDTTVQLEEARRILEDDTSKAKLQNKSKSGAIGKEKFYHVDMGKNVRQSSSSSLPAFKVHPCGVTVTATDSTDDSLATKKTSKRTSAPMSGSSSNPPVTASITSTTIAAFPVTVIANEFTAVVYQFYGEPVPYLTKLPGRNIVLKQFKTLITKKSNFRYFFKRASDEFDSGCVYEELTDDGESLPLFEGKVFARLEAID